MGRAAIQQVTLRAKPRPKESKVGMGAALHLTFAPEIGPWVKGD